MKVVLWFSFSTLFWLPRVYSYCQGINISISIYPEGSIKVPYGETLEIFCQDEMYPADNLEFVIGGESIPSEKLNVTTRRLNIKDHEKGVFAYYCRNKVTKKLCPTRVLVDSAPQNVTDFNCKSKNLEILNCTWTTPETFSSSKMQIMIGGQLVKSWNSLLGGRSVYFTLKSTTTPRYMIQNTQFIFELQTCNYFGCNKQNFTVDHFSIVKPDPPRQLEVLKNGTHGVLLHWKIPSNMVDFLPHGVDHRIEYQITKIDNTSYFRKVDPSGLPPRNLTYKYLLSDLPYAHMQYEVRIYIRPKEAIEDKIWSDFTYAVFYTTSDRPNKPPDAVVGAFYYNKYDTKRRIYVYWQQLKEYEEAGANFAYKVVAHQRTGIPITILADNKKGLNFVVLEEASLEVIQVDIWSQNDNGTSINSSRVYIPPYNDSESIKITNFTVFTYENGTYELTWNRSLNVDNYTLFSCEQKVVRVCTGEMVISTLSSDLNRHFVQLSTDIKHQFAISANKGIASSGMVWPSVEISEETIISYKPSVIKPFPSSAEISEAALSVAEGKKRCLCQCQYDFDFIID